MKESALAAIRTVPFDRMRPGTFPGRDWLARQPLPAFIAGTAIRDRISERFNLQRLGLEGFIRQFHLLGL